MFVPYRCASAAVMFSLLVALTITPYFGFKLLKVDASARRRNTSGSGGQEAAASEKRYARFYRTLLHPFMAYGILRWILYLGLFVLLLTSFSMVGATLTETLTATSAVNRKLRKPPEVKSLTVYAGTPAPFIYPPSGIQVPENLQPHRAKLHVEMVPNQERRRLSYEVSKDVSLKPLGLTLASGVLISTLLTLVLIPILYFHVHRNK